MEFLKGFFTEENGKSSMKRFGRFLLLIVFVVSYIKVAFASNVFIDIPWGWLVLLSAVLGFSEIASIFKK